MYWITTDKIYYFSLRLTGQTDRHSNFCDNESYSLKPITHIGVVYYLIEGFIDNKQT